MSLIRIQRFGMAFVSLTGETRHDLSDDSVQMFILGLLDFENVLTNVVKSFVLKDARHRIFSKANSNALKEKAYVETARDVGVFDQVMSRKKGVVRFDDSVRDLGTGEDCEIAKHS